MPPPPKLVMQGRLVGIRGSLPPALADALVAIPGVPVDVPGLAWALRVGPDRAESLMKVAERHAVEQSDAASAGLAELCSERDLSDPVVEVAGGEGEWLSVMEDWLSLAVEELRAVPGSRPRPDAGRVEVPLTGSTVEPIRRTIASHGLRLSPGAQLALERSDSDDDGRWIARVEIDPGGPTVRIATRWGRPPPELTSLGRGDAVLVAPLSVELLRVLGPVVTREAEVSVAVTVENALGWLERNPAATSVPAAELHLADGQLELETIWDERVATAFAEQEAGLLRRHRERFPTATDLPATAWSAERLARFVRIHRVGCSPAVAGLFPSTPGGEDNAQRLIALSAAADADIAVEGLGGELIPFQRAGVAYALERRRVFLADEQGLGKTVQALATVQADRAYPAVVVCPASLKLNWLREIRTWLPGRTARSVSGQSPQRLEGADVVVLNYEIVGAHHDALRSVAPQALILDESHYVKNARATRTKEVLALAGSLGPDALRLALTGTPIVNRPTELAPQLRALDRLGEYGSASSFRHGYASERARRRLHQRLRSSCYLRRRKRDVLAQLPDKRRAVVTVPLDNEREYRRAERDFVEWLREQVDSELPGGLAGSARGRAIARMTALRRLAARGKLAAALSWLEDFLESEERIVVFAHHREIQDAVAERFPDGARIVGADPPETREENVRRFGSPDGPQLCVCSLEVASHGFTLTEAANVAFLELAWTPAKHHQAEDRLHRIGQARAVTAWYLLAAGTIDERIAALLEAKSEVVESLTDGAGGDGSSLAAAILGEYAAAAVVDDDSQAASGRSS